MLNARYAVVQTLTSGGGSRSYVARDLADGSLVFVKHLPWSEIHEPRAAEHFEREIAALRSMSHPNLPRFIDAFKSDGQDADGMFLVQEYLPGPNLQQRIDAGTPLKPKALATVARAILSALHELHRSNPPLVHRDVKPAHILSDGQGRIVLADLGVVGSAARGLAAGETVAGTPGYRLSTRKPQPHVDRLGSGHGRASVFLEAVARKTVNDRHAGQSGTQSPEQATLRPATVRLRTLVHSNN